MTKRIILLIIVIVVRVVRAYVREAKSDCPRNEKKLFHSTFFMLSRLLTLSRISPYLHHRRRRWASHRIKHPMLLFTQHTRFSCGDLNSRSGGTAELTSLQSFRSVRRMDFAQTDQGRVLELEQGAEGSE